MVDYRVWGSAAARNETVREVLHRSWKQVLESEGQVVISDAQGTAIDNMEWQPQMIQAVKTGGTITSEDGFIVTLPITSRDEVIGVIDAKLPDTEGEWTEEQLIILRAITEQLGAALVSARLYNETQHRASREALSREIADKMRNTLTWEELMQTTLTELHGAVDVSRAFVQWKAPQNNINDQS
jgi:GAF domain-containing protein